MQPFAIFGSDYSVVFAYVVAAEGCDRSRSGRKAVCASGRAVYMRATVFSSLKGASCSPSLFSAATTASRMPM